MNQGVIVQADADQGGDVLILGRFLREDTDHNLVAVTPSDVSSVTRRIVDASDGVTVLNGPTTLTRSVVILSALSTGSVWSGYDSVGFNFRDQVPGEFLTADGPVRIQYTVVYADGTTFQPKIDLSLNPTATGSA